MDNFEQSNWTDGFFGRIWYCQWNESKQTYDTPGITGRGDSTIVGLKQLP